MGDAPEPTSRSLTAWRDGADLPLDVVLYGPDVPTESDLRLLGRLDGKRVLELGSGGGAVAVAMAKQGAKVIGVEPSAEQLAHARRLCEREEVSVELHQGDLAELAFVRADTIDAAVSVFALGSVVDLDRVLRQVHRVLRPDGPFVVSLPHPIWRVVDRAEPPTLQRPYWQSRPRTIGDLFTSFVRAGFAVDTILEPEPTPGGARSAWWDPAMAWVPSTLVIRGRKVGT